MLTLGKESELKQAIEVLSVYDLGLLLSYVSLTRAERPACISVPIPIQIAPDESRRERMRRIRNDHSTC